MTTKFLNGKLRKHQNKLKKKKHPKSKYTNKSKNQPYSPYKALRSYNHMQ